jgi:hypothetical protein
MKQANKEVVADPCICLFDLCNFLIFWSHDSKVSGFPRILADFPSFRKPYLLYRSASALFPARPCAALRGPAAAMLAHSLPAVLAQFGQLPYSAEPKLGALRSLRFHIITSQKLTTTQP